jgi:23S rRNA (guanine745-N1)-methyltransferase
VGGDGLAQLRHRAEFLDAGHLDAVAALVANHVEQRTSLSWHILDAGSGTGHHLARIATRLPGSVISLGLDISKAAARQAARRWPAPAFAVANLWADWPVHDAAIDLVVSIFAPKNFREMARVLRPGGCLALAYPGPEHLMELRDRFGLLGHNQESPGRYATMTAQFIGTPSVARLHGHAVLDSAAIRAAILMGPNARHVDPMILDVGPASLAVTFDINVLFASKTGEES